MITPDDIKDLATPKELSELLGGFDKILEMHACFKGVGATEYKCYKRFIDEYKQSLTDKDYPYYFDPEEANFIIKWVNNLQFFDSGKVINFNLMPFQRFIILNLYGWRSKADNTLRYRNAYISLARRNGKSLLCAALGLFYLYASHFKSSRGIIVSLTRDHAMIVFKQITAFLDADAELDCCINRDNTKGKLTDLQYNNELIAFSGLVDKDGFTSNFAISDEQNASNGKLPQLIMDGQDDQKEALFIGISTASFLIHGWGHQSYLTWIEQLDIGALPATQFLYICEPDPAPDDDLHYYEQSYTWLQANPYLLWNENGTVNEKKLQLYADKCKYAFAHGGDKLVSFITKQCNQWCVNQEIAFCDYEQLESNARDYTFEDVAKLYKEWYIGIDLASIWDFTAITWGCWIFEDDENKLLAPKGKGNKRLYFHTMQFTPQDLLDKHIKSDKFNYRLYVGKELELVPGERMNYKYVYTYIDNIRQKFNIYYKTIAADPYNISSIQDNLEAICETFIQQKQSPKYLSEYLEQLQARINCGDIVYTAGQEDLFKRSILQSRVAKDANGYHYVDKASGHANNTERIDCIDSLLDMVIAPLIEENREQISADEIVDEWLDIFRRK